MRHPFCIVTRLALLAIVSLAVSFASGATITVNTTYPGILAWDGQCSLGEAVENANEGLVYLDCVAGDDGLDVIELGHEATYVGPLDMFVSGDLIINGNGSTLEAEDAGFRFSVDESSCVMNDLTVRGGSVHCDDGRLFINDCSLSDSRVGTSDSMVVLVDTVLSAGTDLNSYGGDNDIALIRCTAIDDFRFGGPFPGADHLLIQDSHISGDITLGPVRHVAIMGSTMEGALFQFYDVGEFIVDRSTLTGFFLIIGATAPPEETSLTIRNSTVQSGLGAAIEGNYHAPVSYARVTLENNVLDCGGHDCLWIETDGSNVVEADLQSLGFNVCTYHSPYLDHNTDMIVDDAMLSDLGDYGGHSPVHMPLEGSPSIDMGSDECGAADQRGYRRPADGDGDGVAVCDCGAVEFGAEPRPLPPGLPKQPQVPPVYE